MMTQHLFLLIIPSILTQLSTAELQSQWTSSQGFHLVATCTEPNPTPCPLGFGCKYGICAPITTNTSTCLNCNYSGGNQPQCTVKCPPNTRLSLNCGVWLAPPNTKPCSSTMDNSVCVKAEIQTCDQEPLKCIQIPCSGTSSTPNKERTETKPNNALSSTPNQELTETKPNNALSIKYFGFWGPDAPAEMSTFTNLAFANDATEAVTNAKYGIHSLIKLHNIFVNTTISWNHHLYPSSYYEPLWETAANEIAPLLSNGSALGFFLGDELLWNGMNFTEIEQYIEIVRQRFPRNNSDAILYTNAAWPTLFPTTPGEPTSTGNIGAIPNANLWLHVPESLDWWGVDVYPDQFSQTGALTVLHSNVLRKFTTSSQQLVVIPPFYGDRVNSTTNGRRQLDCDNGDCDTAMLAWSQQFERTFLNASYRDATRVVAAMPYHWSTLGTGSGMRQQGGKELKQTREAWERIGKSVVQKNLEVGSRNT